MLARINCLYPQALVIVLVVATLKHLQAQRRAHRAQRVGTMLWVYLFAIVLELSYSACLLGNVSCDVVTWYVTCTVLAALGLAVLLRDGHIDATLRAMVASEESLETARATHRRNSALATVVVCAVTAVAAALPHLLLGVGDAPAKVVPLVIAGTALPAVFVVLSRGNGLASALASVAVVAVGVVQAHALASGQEFSVASDMGELASSFLRGQTQLALTTPALTSIALCGIAVALCSALFRLPKVVPAPEEPEAAPAEEAGPAEAQELPEAGVPGPVPATADETVTPPDDGESVSGLE